MCCLHDLFPQSLEANERRRQRQGQQMYEKLQMGIQTRLEMIIAILLKNFFKLTSSLT